MAPPKRNTPRPGRALIGLLVLIGALVGVMFWQNQKTPDLALDLAGGTTVNLTAVPEKKGAKIGSSEMKQAEKIMRQRVNGLGVSEAEVTTQGDNVIVVQVPGKGQERVVGLIGTTARLEFRQVLVAQPVGAAVPQPSPSPSSSGKNDGKKGKDDGTSKSPSPSSSPKGRALGRALTKPTPSPSGSKSSGKNDKKSPSPQSTKSLSPKQLKQLKQRLKQQQQQRAQGQPNFSGIDKAVIARYKKLDCTKRNVGQGQTLPRNKQVAVCAKPTEEKNESTKKSHTKFILGPVKVSGEQVTKAQAVPPNPQAGQPKWTVSLDFDGSGSEAFADFTTKAAKLRGTDRNRFAIVLDGVVVSSPGVEEPITGGSAQIEGSDFTQQTASDLADVLKYGALPLKFKQSSVQSVSPTLGKDQMTAGLIAGAIGLGLVVLYCLLYYRALGLIAILSLVTSAALTYESVSLLGKFIGMRLSLAGIAGLIVAIGITADSFVVYFERLRDEIREGSVLRTAVERGWQRARRTILVADAVSFMAALVLYEFTVGSVRGFAFTLGLTTLIDVVVVFLFTKPVVTLLSRRRFFSGGHRLSGVNPDKLGAKRRTTVRTARRRREA